MVSQMMMQGSALSEYRRTNSLKALGNMSVGDKLVNRNANINMAIIHLFLG